MPAKPAQQRHPPHPRGRVILILEQKSEPLEISVRDSGSGISPEHLPHIFDRFYRADPARTRETGGTDLGLAITRAIIENHRGTILAESPVADQGSTFTVQLPLTKHP